MASGSQLPHPAWQVATHLAGRLLTSQRRADDLLKQGGAAEAMTTLQVAILPLNYVMDRAGAMQCKARQISSGLGGETWGVGVSHPHIGARSRGSRYEIITF